MGLRHWSMLITVMGVFMPPSTVCTDIEKSCYHQIIPENSPPRYIDTKSTKEENILKGALDNAVALEHLSSLLGKQCPKIVVADDIRVADDDNKVSREGHGLWVRIDNAQSEKEAFEAASGFITSEVWGLSKLISESGEINNIEWGGLTGKQLGTKTGDPFFAILYFKLKETRYVPIAKKNEKWIFTKS